jgi:dienelactone hydrolase
MADAKTLGLVGFAMGGVTALVMLLAFLSVKSHLDGRSSFEAPSAVVAGLPAYR